MSRKSNSFSKDERIIFLLEYLLVLGLSKTNLNQAQIAKRLGIAKVKVNVMLKGIEVDK